MRQLRTRDARALRRPIGKAEGEVFLVACLISVASGLIIIGVNLKAIEIGGGVKFLGLLGFVRAATFMLSSIGWGWVSDRFGRRESIVRFSCFLHLVVAVMLVWAGSLGLLTVGAAAFAFTEGMLWSPFEGWLGERAERGGRRRWLGTFNLGWCSGFALGAGAGGVAREMNPGLPFYSAAATCLLAWVVALFLEAVGKRIEEEEVNREVEQIPVDRPMWMRLSWVAGFGNVFCLSSVLNLFPKQGRELLFSDGTVGFLIGLMILGELVAFAFTSLTTSWQRKIAVLAGIQGLTVGGLLWLARSEQAASFIVVFPLVGMTVGIGYSSSLLFSISSPSGKGLRAAIHEGMGALGGLIAPPLGGILAALAGRKMPHLISGLVLTGCILVELQMLRRGRGRVKRS